EHLPAARVETGRRRGTHAQDPLAVELALVDPVAAREVVGGQRRQHGRRPGWIAYAAKPAPFAWRDEVHCPPSPNGHPCRAGRSNHTSVTVSTCGSYGSASPVPSARSFATRSA